VKCPNVSGAWPSYAGPGSYVVARNCLVVSDGPDHSPAALGRRPQGSGEGTMRDALSPPDVGWRNPRPRAIGDSKFAEADMLPCDTWTNSRCKSPRPGVAISVSLTTTEGSATVRADTITPNQRLPLDAILEPNKRFKRACLRRLGARQQYAGKHDHVSDRGVVAVQCRYRGLADLGPRDPARPREVATRTRTPSDQGRLRRSLTDDEARCPYSLRSRRDRRQRCAASTSLIAALTCSSVCV